MTLEHNDSVNAGKKKLALVYLESFDAAHERHNTAFSWPRLLSAGHVLPAYVRN